MKLSETFTSTNIISDILYFVPLVIFILFITGLILSTPLKA